jgi:catechol 2,3-dioxygenase-like lactoylglutathione lyase family enzyme
MNMKLELVAVPVTDVDRAKAFYVDQVGFNADHDVPVSADLRFVQLTPPGSACSIVIGTGITDMAPGSQTGLQVVVDSVEDVRRELGSRGVDDRDRQAALGLVHDIHGPRRQRLGMPADGSPGVTAQRPVKSGSRFSRKAAIPSFWSSEANSR